MAVYLPSGDDPHDSGPTPLLWRAARLKALRRRAPLDGCEWRAVAPGLKPLGLSPAPKLEFLRRV